MRDLHTGVAAARTFALLMLVNGLAPILAPLVGGELLHVTDWRGIFVVLAAIGALLLLAAWAMLAETLAPEARHGGGLVATLRVFRGLVSDREYTGYALAMGLAFGAMAAYIGARPSSCRTSTAPPRRSSACSSRSTRAGSSPPARSGGPWSTATARGRCSTPGCR